MVTLHRMANDLEILKARAISNSVKNIDSQNIAKIPIAIIKFSLLSQVYAFETKYISEVHLIKGITTIPGTPSFVAGVVNLRGRIISAINLKTLLQMGEKGLTDQNRLIVLSLNAIYFGVICDTILGIFTQDRALLKSAPNNLPKSYSTFIEGIFPDNTILLDAHNILTSSEIIISNNEKEL